MSAAGFVALVIVIFFLVGIWVGVIAVMALAARRKDREIHRNVEEDDDRPQWPGNGFRTLTT